MEGVQGSSDRQQQEQPPQKKPCKVCRGFGAAFEAFEQKGGGKEKNAKQTDPGKDSAADRPTVRSDWVILLLVYAQDGVLKLRVGFVWIKALGTGL